MAAKLPKLRLPKKMSLKTTLLVVGALIAYSLLQPTLERWSGVDLPSLVDEPEQVAQSETPASPPVTLPSSSVEAETEATNEAVAKTAPPSQSEPAVASTASKPASKSKPQTKTTTQPKPKKPVPKLGELRDIGRKVLQSTAGLHYRPGSQEGHRVKHVLRHKEDDPDRPVHGVFDGDANEVFAVIDEAYLYTFDRGPPQVTKKKDDGRTVYVVDLGRRIGYLGGQSGKRKDHPACRHVQLVLEGTNVITAYPVRR